MSIEALNWALGHMQRDDIATNEAFVLMILANRADPEGVCWPSVRYIMARTKLAERSVRTSCKRIAELGLMAVEQQTRPDGGKGTNRYFLRLDVPPPARGAPTHLPPGAGAPVHDVPGVGAPGAVNTKGDTSLTDVREPRARRGKKFPIPDDFKLEPEVRTWASEHGLASAYVETQFEAFVDDARSNRRLHADWNAALRTWLRRQPNFDKSAPRPVKGSRATAPSDVRRCYWPSRDSAERCTTTADQDHDGIWLGGAYCCSKHVRAHWQREDEIKTRGARAH